MSFKAEITEDYTRLQGSGAEVLTGLAMYVNALLKANFNKEIIQEVVELAIDDYKASNKKQELDDELKSILKEIFK